MNTIFPFSTYLYKLRRFWLNHTQGFVSVVPFVPVWCVPLSICLCLFVLWRYDKVAVNLPTKTLSLTTRHCERLDFFFFFKRMNISELIEAQAELLTPNIAHTLMAWNRDLLIALFSTVDMKKKKIKTKMWLCKYGNKVKPNPFGRMWLLRECHSPVHRANPKTEMETKTDCSVVLLAFLPHPDADSWADKAFVLFLAFSRFQPLFLQLQQKQPMGRLLCAAMGSAAGCLFDEMGFFCTQTAVLLF